MAGFRAFGSDCAGQTDQKLGDAAQAFDRRFREPIAEDLDMPSAAKLVNELVSSADVSDGEKYALLASWDEVLGLDLERDARARWEPTEEISSLVTERDAARTAKDYARSDEIRDRLQAMGLEVMDTPAGTKVRPQ